MASTPGVVHAGLSAELPGTGFSMTNFIPEGRTEKEALLMQSMEIDDQFLPALDIKIVSGRNFSRSMKTDAAEAVLINETAAAQLGWKDPMGKSISRPGAQARTDSGLRFPKELSGSSRISIPSPCIKKSNRW